jgi:hypothetical protein
MVRTDAIAKDRVPALDFGVTTKAGAASLSIVNHITNWFDVGIEKSHTPTFANNTVQWPPYPILREDVDEEPFHTQRDIATPSLPPDTTLQTNVVAKRETTEHAVVWHFLDSFGKESVEATEAGELGRGPAVVVGKFVRSM